MRTLRDMLYAIIEVRGDAKRSRTQGYGPSAEQLRDNRRRKLKAKLRFDRLLDAGFFNPEVFNDLLEPDGSCPPAVLDLVALQYGYDDFKGFRENFDYEQFTPDDEDLEKVYDEGWLSGFVEGDGLRDAVSDGFKDYVERGVSSFSDFQACCDNALKWANEAGNEYLEDFTYREEDDDDD